MSLDVLTNSFVVKSLPTLTYHQYDVFNPDIKNVRRRQEIMHELSVQNPQLANPRFIFDGQAILYAQRVLDLHGSSGGTIRVFSKNKDVPHGGGIAGGSGDKPPRGCIDVTLHRTQGAVIKPLELNSLIQRQGSIMTAQSAKAINLLQLLVRQGQNWVKQPRTTRAYYVDAGKSTTSSGYEYWRGFFQSVRPTVGRMIVNVDITMATMIQSGRVIDVALAVLDAFRGRGQRRNIRDLRLAASDREFQLLDKFFKNKGKKVTVYLDYVSSSSKARPVKTIYGLEPRGGRYVFTTSDGGSTTVESFFKSQYNKTLLDPDVFGLILSPPDSPNKSVVPAELCSITPGQFSRGKLPEWAVPPGSIQKFASLRPDERLAAIHNGKVGRVQLEGPLQQYSTNDLILGSGMQIERQPLQIRGHVLDPPRLQYYLEQIKPNKGTWNVMRKRLYKPRPLKNWAIVNYEPSIPMAIVEEFKRTLVECCRNLGKPTPYIRMKRVCFGISLFTADLIVPIADEPSYVATANPQSGTKNLNDAIRTMNPETFPDHPPLILAILPQNAADLRAIVKWWGDIHTGARTQCVREGKIYFRGRAAFNDQYCNNVVLKQLRLNARIGGVNAAVNSPLLLHLSEKSNTRYIIMGADVGHPSPGVSDRPSVASLVFSIDQYSARYAALSTVQPPRQEIIVNLRKMVHDAILADRRGPPALIVFYRDGVSEGQYAEVATQEIAAIRGAIEEIWVSKALQIPRPKLTFIVVSKRHHTCFFLTKGVEAENKSGNCPAGFVADTGIQSPFAMDFYLLSHAGLLGTSKPSHYIVLLDEVYNGNVQMIEELSFALCHVYAKATRSVSIPAPVYYADLVCSRANFYFDRNLDYTGSDSATAASGGTRFDLSIWEKGYKTINDHTNRSMYYL